MALKKIYFSQLSVFRKSIIILNQRYAFILIATLVFFSSCATICGGSNYYAHINIEGHPKAHITCNGLERGMGQAVFKVKRSNADKLLIVVKEDGCEQQTFD